MAKKRTVYINIYNVGKTNLDGSTPKDYDGKVAFRTPEAALKVGTARGHAKHVRVEERQLTDEQLKAFILDEEFEQ